MTSAALVYGKSGCSYCTKVKTLLASNSVPYSYVDIDHDEESKKKVVRYWVSKGESPTVPLVIIDGQYIGGYDETEAYLKTNLY